MVPSDEFETVEADAPAAAVVVRKPRKKAMKPAAKATVKAKGKGNGKGKRMAKARKARTVDPAKLDQFGFRKGTLKSRAALMYASKHGATLNEVKDKLKTTQYNLLTELEGKGFKIKREKVSGSHDRPVTKFHLIAQ